MRLPRINITVLKYVVALMAAAGIFFSQAQAVLPVAYDPDRVMEPGRYTKGQKYEIKKTIEAPREHHTDTSGDEEQQIAYYQKKYKKLPSSWVAYLYKQCAKEHGCNIDKLLAASSRETSHLLRRPSMWSRLKHKVFDYFTSNLMASRAKRATPTKGLLIAWLEKFVFWKKGNVAGQFVHQKIVTPTIAMVKYAGKMTQQVANHIEESAIHLTSLLAKPDPEKLKFSDPLGYSSHVNYYNNFKYDYNDPRIPASYKEALTWSYNWNPKNFPDDPVECVAFVVMVYNDAGISLKGKTPGDAIDWKDNTDVFNVYNSGVSAVPPQKGDVLVWDDISSGHVGIISKIVLRNETTFKIFIQQGNSSELQSVYNFSIDPKTKKVTVQNANDGTSRPPPKWWLRVK